jgi:RNA polymerase sigma-70 factor (ECF subfamily)
MQQDSQLIIKLQKGDQRAFAKIYDKYSGALYHVLLKITGQEATAQDLLQETFISIWNKSHQFNPEKGRFYTWAYRIARHKALNHLRSEKKLIQKEDLGVYISEEAQEAVDSEIHGLEGALLKLESHHRTAIDLVYFKGLTHIEAHKKMKVPLGTFKSYVQQAMRALRKEYKITLSLLILVFFK